MNRIFCFLKRLIARFKQSDFFDRYQAAAAMAEGSGDMAREFLHDTKEEQNRIAELRLEFKARYHAFKLLLQANKCALENMAHVEKALQDGRPFAMPFIHGKATAISVDVYRMIRNLQEIAPHKYSRLNTSYDAIQTSIRDLLEIEGSEVHDKLIIPFQEIDSSMNRLVGNKMAKTAEIRNKIGLTVPEGFAVTTVAYRKLMQTNQLQERIDKQFQGVDFDDMKSIHAAGTNIRQLIMDSRLPAELEAAIRNGYRMLKKDNVNLMVALRSSAQGEDQEGTSFAGQYYSELNVSEDSLIEAYKRVIAGKYRLQAITYRYNLGIKDEDVSMGVGCMVIVDSVAGGVVYSRNPVNMEDTSIYIDSCWGLAKTVVEGVAACDQFMMSRQPSFAVLSRQIHSKRVKYACAPEGGISETPISQELQNLPSISDSTASLLAEIAVKLEDHYGEPQDIEWALAKNGSLYILQCRPLFRAKPKEEQPVEKEAVAVRSNLIAEGGICVSAGVACGPVYRLETKGDFPDCPEGAILITARALPRWAPFLSKVAGIITEEGSFAGHLANVAREFGVPALFGFEGVKEILENGMTVTLDADHGQVHAGRIESLLKNTEKRKNLMTGSPVYETLAAVSRHIVPLNLLDPDAVDFRPSNCRTLHDITRFIHEKSVAEMFNFGNTHHFSERSAKQLFYNVPMQWWILNLDDGFIKETDGRYVKLDNIASIPMLALWEGIVAIPWEGPPPIDGRGLLSVMFQATTNRALTAGAGKRFADRNYFMISRNFCSLSSRLGFHFTTVESMVSEIREENYVSFQYKGGAADYKRRLNRVLFLGELLEEYEFTVDIRKDNLIARLENRSAEFIKERLRILGYLIIHSRQIDMIMLNNSSIEYYKSKFTKDITSFTMLSEVGMTS